MADRVDWLSILNHENLSQAGAGKTKRVDMAEALAQITGEPITTSALETAYRRHARRLGLPASITEYFDKGVNQPQLRDIRFPLSRRRRIAVSRARRWVVTSAVNNTPVSARAWAALRRYARKHEAEILVIPIRYQNPTTIDTNNDYKYWWAEELTPYLCDDAITLHPRCVYAGHIHVQATAVDPLIGLRTLTRQANGLIGHPQLRMETVPTPQSDEAKVMTTTMAVTEPIYSTTKQGARGEFHHSVGAVVVEVDNHGHYLRHLTCDDDGSFYDVAGGELRRYHDKGSHRAQAEYLVVSDEHAPFTEAKNKQATYTDSKSIAKVCRPQYIVRHDVADMFAINPHDSKDPIKRIAGHKLGFNSIKGEMERCADYVRETTPPGAVNVFPWSNHPNEHLLRWVKKTSVPFDEPWNAEEWLDLFSHVVKSIRPIPGGFTHDDPFTVWMGKLLADLDCRFLAADEGFMVAGVEVGFHGHLGPNGARGSRRNMSAIGVRSIIGHGHSPGILHGCWQVGTMTRDLNYARGPSGWACWQVIGLPNGKRQGYFINDAGRWYAQ